MREVGMGLDQSSPKTALVINNVALFVALTVFQTLQASDCLSIRFLTQPLLDSQQARENAWKSAGVVTVCRMFCRR